MQRAFYMHSVGAGESPQLEDVYSDYSQLFSHNTIASLRKMISTNEIINSRLKYLIEFISVEYVNKSLLPLKQQLLDLKSLKHKQPDGNQLSYYEMKQKLFWAADMEKEEIENRLKQFTEKKLNSLLQRIFQCEIKTINELGYKDHCEMFVHLTGIDPIAWKDVAAKFLADTSEVYFRKLNKYKERYLGGRDRDVSRDELFKSLWEQGDDDCFKSIEPTELFKRIIKKNGAEDIADSIKLELIYHTGRAFCSPLNVPNDIRLVIGQGRGFHQIRDLMHEAGHALHYASVDDRLPFEFSRLGDDSVTESYAALMENLVYDLNWLEIATGTDKIQKSELISFLKFYKLTKLRSIALKSIYEFDVYCGLSEEVLKANYSFCHKQHLGVDVKEYEYRTETEPFLFSMRYFRAQMLAGNLRQKLETSFGLNWFENRKAFKELSGLWKSGQQYSPEEISETYCGKGLIEADITSEFK